MSLALNGVGRTLAYLNRYDSTLLAYVAWDGQGAAGAAGSTQVAVSSLAGQVTVAPISTAFALNSGFHFDGSGNLNIAGSFSASTTVNVSSLAGKVTVDQISTVWAVQLSQYSTTVNVSSLAGKVTVDQISTVWQVQSNGNSTVFQGTNPWVIAGNSTVAPLAGSTWATRPIQSSAADLQMTATPAAGSTWNTRTLQSSHADLQVDAWVKDRLGTAIDGSSIASGVSTRYGLAVREQQMPTASKSGQAATAGDNTIVSSLAAKAVYVYAWTLTQLSTAANLVRWMDGSTTEVWRMRILGGSTAGMNYVTSELAVTPPAFLFKTTAANPLILNCASSGVNFGVAYWQE